MTLLCVLALLLAGCTVRQPHYYTRHNLTACVRHSFVTALGTVEGAAIIASGTATMEECIRAVGP